MKHGQYSIFLTEPKCTMWPKYSANFNGNWSWIQPCAAMVSVPLLPPLSPLAKGHSYMLTPFQAKAGAFSLIEIIWNTPRVFKDRSEYTCFPTILIIIVCCWLTWSLRWVLRVWVQSIQKNLQTIAQTLPGDSGGLQSPGFAFCKR